MEANVPHHLPTGQGQTRLPGTGQGSITRRAELMDGQPGQIKRKEQREPNAKQQTRAAALGFARGIPGEPRYNRSSTARPTTQRAWLRPPVPNHRQPACNATHPCAYSHQPLKLVGGGQVGSISKPVKLGPRTTAWSVSDIRALVERMSPRQG